MLDFLKIKAFDGFLINMGTRTFQHINKFSLYDHLKRVGKIVEGWGLDSEDIIFAMGHSLYSTEYYNKKILNINNLEDKNKLINISNQRVEKLIQIFSEIDRESFWNEEDIFYFKKYSNTEECITLNKKDFISVLHILIANELDHMTPSNSIKNISLFRKYFKFYDLLCLEAQKMLEQYSDNSLLKIENKTDVLLRFIAHAGINIFDKKSSLVIDPWIYPSSIEAPILEGLDPTSRTIDFQIPESKTSIKEISPDIILLSHFHTHHAPLREIKEFLLLKPVTIVCPLLSEEKLKILKKSLPEDLFNKITFLFLKDLYIQDFQILDFNIKALKQIHKNHFCFYVNYKNTSLLHIADARMNSDNNRNDLDEKIWSNYKNLKPDFLFLSVASHSQRVINTNLEKDILENSTLSPVQAAKLTKYLSPKFVAPIGIYNFSICMNRLEYVLPQTEVHFQFYWAMSFLCPNIKVLNPNPGDILYTKSSCLY